MLLRTVDIQTPRIYFDLWSGYFEPANVRYEDRVIPAKVGLWRGNRVEESRDIDLRGYVRGLGSTPQERTEDWHDATVALMALLDRTLAPGPLVLPQGYLGLPSDVSLDVFTVNIIPGQIRSCMSYQKWSIELRAIDVLDWESESS